MFLPMREAATAKREKIKRVDAASDKRVAALYLETNKQYAIDFMANNAKRIITEAVSDIKKWSADEKNRHTKGICNSNCPRKTDHITYTATEYTPMVNWCRDHGYKQE
jgi:hypothetical protein